jgi:catechol 2,3-dioxygenase-like lactoylglutathione lyase family enzyme
MDEPNLKQAVPFFMVTDMAASLNFYVDGLGFRKTLEWVDEGALRWCWLQQEGVVLMLQAWRPGRRPEGPLGQGVSVCVMCADALRFRRETRARGVEAVRQPFVGNGLWVVQYLDPDGYRLDFESPTDAPEESIWEAD